MQREMQCCTRAVRINVDLWDSFSGIGGYKADTREQGRVCFSPRRCGLKMRLFDGDGLYSTEKKDTRI